MPKSTSPKTSPSLPHLITLEEAIKRRAEIERFVFTNGVFDLFHAGHAEYLKEARQLGTALFVGLNSDQSAATLKGPTRPLCDQISRAKVLLALEAVDAVIIFDELTADSLIEALHPDVYVKGGDYVITPPTPLHLPNGTPTKILPESKIVQAYGGTVELIPYESGFSTTELIERIINRFSDM